MVDGSFFAFYLLSTLHYKKLKKEKEKSFHLISYLNRYYTPTFTNGTNVSED